MQKKSMQKQAFAFFEQVWQSCYLTD